MKTILDVVKDLRESDSPLTYLRRDESVAYGKFLKSEVVHWNGKRNYSRLAPATTRFLLRIETGLYFGP